MYYTELETVGREYFAALGVGLTRDQHREEDIEAYLLSRWGTIASRYVAGAGDAVEEGEEEEAEEEAQAAAAGLTARIGFGPQAWEEGFIRFAP